MYHTCFCFCFMRAIIHALRCSSSFSSRCTHSCAVFVHALHSFMHCIHSFVAFMHTLYSFIRRTHVWAIFTLASHSFIMHYIHSRTYSCAAFIHSALQSCHTHRMHSCAVSWNVLLPFMYHIHGLMPPSLFPLPVMYHVEYSAPY